MARSRYPYVLPQHQIDYGVQVQVADLKVDPQAQRTLNERRAQGIADTFVPEAVGQIIVSQRANGEQFVVDGFHRKRVHELLGLPTIWAEIHHGLTVMEEAILFLIKNRESAKPSAMDEYNVGLTAGLPLFVDTKRVIDGHNLALGATGPNSIGAVAGVLRITDTYGPDTLDRAIAVAEEAWGRTDTTWDGMILGGLGMVLGKHGGLINDHDLALKLGKLTAARWRARIASVSSDGGSQHTGTGSRVSTAYRLFLAEWNKGRREKNKIAA